MADEIAGLWWLHDGVTDFELIAIGELATMTRLAEGLGREIVRLPWMADGVTRIETEALQRLAVIAAYDAELTLRILDYAWLRDGVTYNEKEVIHGLHGIVWRDVALGRQMVAVPWVAEATSVNYLHWSMLDDLAMITGVDANLGREMGDMISVTFNHPQRHTLGALRALVQGQPIAYEALAEQDWYSDGLSGEEIAFLMTSKDLLTHSPDHYFRMLETRYTQSSTIELPLSGSVNLWAIQEVPFPADDDTLELMATNVRLLEELTGTPFPASDLVALIIIVDEDSDSDVPYSDLHQDWPGAGWEASHIRLTRNGTQGVSESALAHELAHYYFHMLPVWFTDGGAEFAASFIRERTNTVSLTRRQDQLEDWTESTCLEYGASSVYSLGLPGMSYLAARYRSCYYILGEHFLNSLRLLLGDDATRAALRDFFRDTLDHVREGAVTAKHIYLAFEAHVVPSKRARFDQLWRDLHGGPLLESASRPADDHGDDQPSATALTIGQTVPGVLEHQFDTDYMRFTAEAGETFHVSLAHDVITYFGFTRNFERPDLLARLYSPSGGSPDYLLTDLSGLRGSLMEWRAPETGDYYLALESMSGVTGSYTVLFEPSGVTSDDHGNWEDSATVVSISPGEESAPLAGMLEYGADTDFFLVETVIGDVYTAVVKTESTKSPCLWVTRPGGVFADEEMGEWTCWLYDATFSWKAAVPGPYFVLVYSPEGDIGDYTLTVTHTASVLDDHGDTADTATSLPPDTVVDGELDHATDTDFFVFRAERLQPYIIRMNHITTTTMPIWILGEDGEKVLLEHRPFERPHVGAMIPWVSEVPGNFYVKVDSLDGRVGSYTIAIVTGRDGEDDHGDFARAATPLALDQEESGRLDSDFDFDWFRLRTAPNKRYEVVLSYDSTPETTLDPRISLYGRDGVTPEFPLIGMGRRESGAYIQWEPATGGFYYMVVWNQNGKSKPYTIHVSEYNP